MNHQIEHLQELNSLLADYAESLTAAAANAPLTSQSRDALLQVYDLQAKVARRIYDLLDAEAEVPVKALSKPRTVGKPARAVSGFKKIVLETKLRRHESLDKIIGDPKFNRRFEELHTILGPNEFPDDRPTTRLVLGPNTFPDDPRPKPKERGG